MDIASHIRVAVGVFLLGLTLLGQKNLTSKPQAQASNRSSQGAGQNTSSQAPTQRPAQQRASGPIQQQQRDQSSLPCTPASSSSTESKESFSQLTLFLFASGLALFIALLGWSDQIRGIDKDTRELEHRFLEDTGINKRDFLGIVKPESADDQLVALTEVVNAGRIKTRASVEVLRTFTTWNSQWSRIERLSAWKYNLTIALTISLFAAGIASLFTTPTQQVRIHLSFSVRAEMVILILPMTLVGLLLVIIICSAQQEKALRSLLNSMADMV